VREIYNRKRKQEILFSVPKSAIDFYQGVILALFNKKSAKKTKNAYYKPLH